MKPIKSLPKVPCPKCDGTGVVQISEGHFRVLQILKKIGRASTSWDLFKHEDFKDNVTAGAVCNRMDDLYKQGLVLRVRVGRAFKYSVP